MKLDATIEVDPESVAASVVFTTEDCSTAFSVPIDPDEDLFFNIFYSPAFKSHPVSVQLRLLSRLAELNEMAVTLGLQASEPEGK